MEETKMNFFERMKIAIFKLEDYGKFVNEKIFSSVKYFFALILILACVLSGISTNQIFKMITKGIAYFKSQTIDFSYSDGKLQADNYLEGYDDEYEIGFVLDTSDDVSDEKITEYEEKISNSGVIILKEKMIYTIGGISEEYNYAEIFSEYDIEEFNRSTLMEKIDSISNARIISTFFIIFLIIFYISQLISIFSDWVVISVFAWLVSKICRVKCNFKNAFNISIYALTLPILLACLYEIANALCGFYTEYFRMVYLLISYVYIIAAILMMKSDGIKVTAEVGKIEEDKKVKEENEITEEKDDTEKENNDNENDNDNKEKEENKDNNEPDGSEI